MLSFDGPLRGTPENIRTYLIFPETRIVGLHIATHSLGLPSFSFFLASSVKQFFSARVRFGRSRSSKVIDFGTIRKLIYDFLLDWHSKFGPILHHFGDIAGLCAHDSTPSLFHRNFGCDPVGPDHPCWCQPERKP